jgi:hypothetical protein
MKSCCKGCTADTQTKTFYSKVFVCIKTKDLWLAASLLLCRACRRARIPLLRFIVGALIAAYWYKGLLSLQSYSKLVQEVGAVGCKIVFYKIKMRLLACIRPSEVGTREESVCEVLCRNPGTVSSERYFNLLPTGLALRNTHTHIPKECASH